MAVFLLSPLARQSWSGALVTPGFVALSASAIVPLAHAVQLYGWHRMSQMVGLEYVLAQGALHCFGLLCMLARIFSPIGLGFTNNHTDIHAGTCEAW